MATSRPSTNFYGPQVTKGDYDRAFAKARLWALESEEHRSIDTARIYHVKEPALVKSVFRARKRLRNTEGLYNTWGGNNKILNEAQEDAIRQYCYEQWEIGLGATCYLSFKTGIVC
jgi:hypothetical protein